jgi:uncharacterized protein (TIRG00374 family)
MRLLRIGLAVGLLWYAAHGVDWGQVGTALRRASWGWIALAVALVVVDRVLMAWRWLVLLRALETGPPLPLARVLRVFFISTFAGTFLPGSIGGDTLRAVAVSRLGVSMSDSVASVAVDRLLGTVSVFLMAVVGVGLSQLDNTVLFTVALAAAALAVAGSYALLFDARIFRRALQILNVARWPLVDRLAHKFLSAVGQYRIHQRTLAGVLGVSVAVQVLRTLQTWCLGLALGLTVSGIWYFATVPVIVLVVLLPVSIGGLGTANLAFVKLFAVAGVAEEPALLLSILFLALGTVGNLPGGVLLALTSEPPKTS